MNDDGIPLDELIGLFKLKRDPHYCNLTILFPLFVTFFLSWAGFWVDASLAPARIMLTVLTMLLALTLYVRLHQLLPPVSYKVLLFDYTLGVTFMMALHLVLYIFLHGIMKLNKAWAGELKQRAEDAEENAPQPTLGNINKFTIWVEHNLDRHCRWVSPLIFGMFSLIMFLGVESLYS